MAEMGWFEATGYGKAAINGTTAVAGQVALAHIGTVTNPRIVIQGTDEPRNVLYAGSFGVGSEDIAEDSSTLYSVNTRWSITSTQMGVLIPTAWFFSGGAYLLWFFWWLRPGCTWWFNVIYA